jgi:hypothetical protein
MLDQQRDALIAQRTRTLNNESATVGALAGELRTTLQASPPARLLLASNDGRRCVDCICEVRAHPRCEITPTALAAEGLLAPRDYFRIN